MKKLTNNKIITQIFIPIFFLILSCSENSSPNSYELTSSDSLEVEESLPTEDSSTMYQSYSTENTSSNEDLEIADVNVSSGNTYVYDINKNIIANSQYCIKDGDDFKFSNCIIVKLDNSGNTYVYDKNLNKIYQFLSNFLRK
jgi:hypothetical protein